MRQTFVDFCEGRARADAKFFLLSADLGYGIFDSFRSSFNDRFINVGVAEQNMIGIATGMAMSGLLPICYSLGNFPTLRCFEQIRNDAAYHGASIVIVSSGGGFGYGQLGMSHHATEDVGAMRALPGVEIFVPSCKYEAELLFPFIYDRPGVKYVRVEKSGPAYVPINKAPLNDGYFLYRKGDDGLVLAMGTTVEEAMKAAESLSADGIEVSVCSLAVVKSRDQAHAQRLADLLGQHKKIVTIEEHNVIGGVGSYVCDIIATAGLGIRVFKLGMKDCYSSVVGDQRYLRDHYGINGDRIESHFRETNND